MSEEKKVVKTNDWVFVHYTGKFEDGKVFDSSRNGSPLDFVVGEGGLIEGFEKGVMGMAIGEKKTIKLTPAEGYGEYDEKAVFNVPIENFGEKPELEKGMQIVVTPQDGQEFLATIADFDEKTVKLDTNHPLAGKVLMFELEVMDIKPSCERPQHTCHGCCGSCGGSCH